MSYQTSCSKARNDEHGSLSSPLSSSISYFFKYFSIVDCVFLSWSALAAGSKFPSFTVWFSCIMESSLQADHKEETDGNRNSDRAAVGLFITRSSQEDSRGASWKEELQSNKTFILSPGFVLPSVQSSIWFRKTFVFLCVSCNNINFSTENHELLVFYYLLIWLKLHDIFWSILDAVLF